MCGLIELKQVRDWEKRLVEFKPYYETLLTENLGTRCREWSAGKNNAEVQMFVETNSKPFGIVIYTGSVTGAGLVGGSQSSRVEVMYTKTLVPPESRPPVLP